MPPTDLVGDDDTGVNEGAEADDGSKAATPVVFVIDDHPGMRKSLQYLIESAGLRVVTYGTPANFSMFMMPASAAVSSSTCECRG